MAMTRAGLMQAVADALTAITPSVGQVHQRRRTMPDLSAVQRVLMDPSTGKLRGAFLSLTGFPEADRSMGGPTSARRYLLTARVRIELFRGVEDAEDSQGGFEDTVWAVLDGINTVGRIYDQSSYQGPLTCREIGYYEMPGGVLLHYADCVMDVRGQQ